MLVAELHHREFAGAPGPFQPEVPRRGPTMSCLRPLLGFSDTVGVGKAMLPYVQNFWTWDVYWANGDRGRDAPGDTQRD